MIDSTGVSVATTWIAEQGHPVLSFAVLELTSGPSSWDRSRLVNKELPLSGLVEQCTISTRVFTATKPMPPRLLM